MRLVPTLVEWLVQRGLPIQRAVLWAEFVGDALDLLRDAHALLRSPPEWNSFLTGCHRRIPTEPEVTSGLGDRMQRLRADAAQGSARDQVFVTCEWLVPGDHSHGIRKPKADFCFKRKFEAGYCAAFVVEAKRLSAPSDMARKYLAIAGLGCFISRTPPYTKDVLGGMVGYAYRSVTPNWYERVRAGIAAPVCATVRVDYVSLDAAGQHLLLVSDHDRAAISLTEHVTVLHMMLDF